MAFTPEQEEYLLKGMERVQRAILGDEELEHEGLISKVAKHEKHINNSKKRRWTLYGITLGATTTIPQLIEQLKKLI